MAKTEGAELARICREQARLGSTREVRKVLTELARHYEGGDPPQSAAPTDETPRERLE